MNLGRYCKFIILGILLVINSGAFAQIMGHDFIEKLLKKHPERFETILASPEKYQVQILYTKIDRNNRNEPKFATYGYGVNSNQYFYPASTVKLAIVALALEKMNKLGLDINTPMFIGKDRPSQTSVGVDTTSENGLPSVAHYCKKILLVSDNDAYNRLYEFLGQQWINDSLAAKGYTQSRISHRLESGMSAEENRYTNPVVLNRKGKVNMAFEIPARYSEKTYWSKTPILQGKGYINGSGELVNEPFDFTQKNYFGLEDQHKLLKSLYFPASVPAKERFGLTEADYQFIYRYMSQFPVETSFPANYTDDYYDAYVKFLLFGATNTRLPRHIRLYNKSGNAYGFLLDNAYIADFEKGIEFMVTAVIYCNDNEIFNDDTYQYDTVGLPFMANLGKTLFEFELSRKYKNRPDFGRFEVEYDK